MQGSDTIAAIATPNGNGGIGIIRISGSQSKTIAQHILQTSVPAGGKATLSSFFDLDRNIIDQGIVLWFPGPHSFTGEDIVELQAHGGTVVLNMILQAVLSMGARLANPGEFSQRAFLNDKIDLTQAEAIADLIESGSEMAAKSALRSLQGAFSKAIAQLQTQLVTIRMYVESAIDFPEEEIDFLSDGKIMSQIMLLLDVFQDIQTKAQQGHVLRKGMVVVIAGKPNVGKSSLLNCLSGRHSAIVTSVSGTTRDILKEYIHLDGMPLHIIDTAGLRESSDIIEQEGIRRAIEAVKQADRILLIVDDRWQEQAIQAEITTFRSYDVPITVVRNKVDLSTGSSGERIKCEGVQQIAISAKHNDGIEALREHLKQCMGFHRVEADIFLARQRHLDALEKAKQCVKTGMLQLANHQAGELLAEDLQQAQKCLSMITGEYTNDDLLSEIFSSFCIGK